MDVLITPHMVLNLYLFPFQVRLQMLFSSLLYSAAHFMKGRTKTDHDHSGIHTYVVG